MGGKIFSSVLAIMVGLMLTTGAFAAQTQYCKDLDLDGYGNPADCEAAYEIGLVDNDGDCNDLDDTINPAAEEICGDLIDNNCMDGIDEGCPTEVFGKISYCLDQDLDNYGNPNDCVKDPEPGYIANDGDCDDTDPAINPGVIEICGDGINNNCLNGVDEGCSTTDNKQYYYLDSDGDGFGDQNTWEYVTNPSTGYVSDPGDCNDQDLAINPGMTEICSTTDPTDENCDNVANEGCSFWWEDADGDGYTSGVNYYDSVQQTGYVLEFALVGMDLDCDDQDGTVNPGAPEIYGDQIDQNCDGEISLFADQNLETCVLQHTDGSLEPAALNGLTYFHCPGRSIVTLTGMEQLSGLTRLYLNNNNISDLTPLANLTGLTYLNLHNNNISDLTPLANLTGLSNLDLSSNNISDLTPLANLTGLTSLVLSVNNISDLTPLANLTGLYNLYLTRSNISDLTGLGNLTGLTNLDLRYNNISDLTPLTNLTGLSNLDLSSSNISDLTGLENLTGLRILSLHSNNISDLTPLANLTGLTSLSLPRNNISDLTGLANLTGLTNLGLSYNNISDLTPLASLTGLSNLFLDSNNISDLAGLGNLTGLTGLYLRYNNISDLTGLANLTGLSYLFLDSNNISDLTGLANLTGLKRLFLDSNNISDLTGLANLTGLGFLSFSSNNISDLSQLDWANNLPNLNVLRLSYNCITDFTPVEYEGGPLVYGKTQQCM
jgi:internalin A